MKFILNFAEVRMCNSSDSKSLSMMASEDTHAWNLSTLFLWQKGNLMDLIKDFYDGAVLLICLTTLHINT